MQELKDLKVMPGERIIQYPYQQIVGKLLYLVNTTRLDIAFVVGYLACAQINPQQIYNKIIGHLLSYLTCHQKYGLVHRKSSMSKIELYADTDFAADKK